MTMKTFRSREIYMEKYAKDESRTTQAKEGSESEFESAKKHNSNDKHSLRCRRR